MEDKVIIDVKDLNKLIDENNKYKQMWGKLGGCSYRFRNMDNYNHLEELMKDIEQEHFPTFKKTITFTIEAPTEHYLGTAINDFEIFWADYNGIQGHCAKYYYGEK